MTERIISPTGRGFLLLDAHPDGCARSVTTMADGIEPVSPARRPVALIIGSSAGYGLATTIAGLARPGILVAEAAEDLGVTEHQLREDLELLWVCGLPGLSTMTTRAFVVVGMASAGRAGVPRCQLPNAFSASARSSFIEMSPATTSAALLGTKFCFQNPSMSPIAASTT